MSFAMRKDNREFSRTQIEAEADITDGKASIHGRVSDLSIRGICMLSQYHFPDGTTCTINLYLSDHSLCISARGRVARTLADGMAVEFTEIDVDSFQHLRNLVRMNAKNVTQVEREFKNHLGLKKPKMPQERKNENLDC